MAAEPYTLVLEFSRAKEAGDPFAMRMEPQVYNRRFADKTYKDAELAWDEPFVAAIEALRAPKRDPEIVQRLGNELRAFLEKTGWAREEAALSLAVDEKRPVVLTIRSAAAELYTLPWELLALGQTMRHVGELPNVTVRYEWPGTKTRAEEPSPRPEGGRIFLAHSHAGGKVLANEHMEAIQDACDEAGHEFDMERDVLAQASRRTLGEALAEARKQNKPIAVLELLAHGGPIGSTFGLMLDPDDAGGPPGVDSDRLASLLAEYADMVRLVVLIACDSGNSGKLGNHMGSVAQALHRAGVAAVVASRYPFSVKGAGEFVRAFYRELLVPPRSVEDAFVAARQRLAAVATRLDWASVQLYAREDDGMDSRPLVVRPYQGLLPLGPAQNRFFFGRDKEAQEIVSDLGALVKASKPRFVVVEGWSGTGKSSMVMAGAVPRLTRPADPAAGAPGEPGWSPGYALATMKPGGDPETSLDLAIGREKRRPLLLVVDQLEEIFTHAREPKRTGFARRLWEIARDPASGVSVIVTVRSDFIGPCGEILLDDTGRRLDRVANDDAFSVRVSQLSKEQLRETIVEPAARVGLVIEASLVNRILREIGTALGALPLIAHTMNLLWEERSGRVLTVGAYEAIGTVTGALHKHANGLVDALDEPGRKMAERLFVGLVAQEVEAEGASPGTRRRLTIKGIRDELCHGDRALGEGFDAMLGSLENGRLLVVDGEGDRKTVEVAHEALIRGWARLDEWLERHGDMFRRKKELDRWLAMSRSLGTLLNEKQIDTAAAFKRDYPEAFSRDAEGLFTKSRRRLARSKWLRRVGILATVFVAVTGLVGGVIMYLLKHDADHLAQIAQRNAKSVADAALIKVAKQHLDQNDPFTAMQLLNAVEQPDRRTEWLNLALEVLKGAPVAKFQGEALRGPAGEIGEVEAMAWSPDGKWVASGFKDGQAWIWSLDNPRSPERLGGQAGRVAAVAFSDDGGLVATGSDDGIARVWSVKSPRSPLELEAHDGPVRGVAFGQGKTLLTWSGADGIARVWSDVSPEPGRAAPPGSTPLGGPGARFASAAWSEDRALVVTASSDGIVRVWDPKDPRKPKLASASGGVALRRALLAGRHVLTVDVEDGIEAWAVTDTGITPERHLARSKLGVEASDDLGRLHAAAIDVHGLRAAFGFAGGKAFWWSFDEDRAKKLVPIEKRDGASAHKGAVRSVTFGPADDDDPPSILTTSNDGTARVWSYDVVTAEMSDRTVLRHADRVGAATFSPSGKLVVTGSADGTVRLWRAVQQGAIDLEGVASVAFDARDTVMIAVLDDAGVKREQAYAAVWPGDRTRGKPEGEVRGAAGSKELRATALSRDGKVFAGVSADGVVHVFRTGALDAPPIDVQGAPPATESPDPPDLGPDGSEMLVVSKDGKPELRSTLDPRAAATVFEHGGEIVAAASFADDKLIRTIVAGSTDGSVYAWNRASPRAPLKQLFPGQARVRSIALGQGPRGAQILAVSEAGVACVFGLIMAKVPPSPGTLEDAGRQEAQGFEERGCLKDKDDNDAKLADYRLSPDGTWVAGVLDSTKDVVVWGVDDSGKPAGHVSLQKPATTMAFSADSSRLLTASNDPTAWVFKLGDVAQALEEQALEPDVTVRAAGLGGHRSGVRSAGFHANGKGAVTVSNDGTARLWEIDVGDVKRRLEDSSIDCPSESDLSAYLEGLEEALQNTGITVAKIHRDCVNAPHRGSAVPSDAPSVAPVKAALSAAKAAVKAKLEERRKSEAAGAAKE
jgi:WD40 repeat protein